MRKIIELILNWLKSLFSRKKTETETKPQTETGTTTPSTGEGGSVGTDVTEKPHIGSEQEEPEPNVPANTTLANVDPPKKEPKGIIVLLDNGHAKSTPGKRSPKKDNGDQFFEYEFNRDIVRRICEKLDMLGIKHETLVPETENDISLTSRAARANKFVNLYGVDKCLFLSVHANASGNGSQWMDPNGWSCYTSKGETAADPYAEVFMCEAEKILVPMGRKIRKYSQKKYSWENNYTVLVKTKCPAVLTENLFYDNKEDLEFLQSEVGRDAIAQIHVNAIEKINNPD